MTNINRNPIVWFAVISVIGFISVSSDNKFEVFTVFMFAFLFAKIVEIIDMLHSKK